MLIVQINLFIFSSPGLFITPKISYENPTLGCQFCELSMAYFHAEVDSRQQRLFFEYIYCLTITHLQV